MTLARKGGDNLGGRHAGCERRGELTEKSEGVLLGADWRKKREWGDTR